MLESMYVYRDVCDLDFDLDIKSTSTLRLWLMASLGLGPTTLVRQIAPSRRNTESDVLSNFVPPNSLDCYDKVRRREVQSDAFDGKLATV